MTYSIDQNCHCLWDTIPKVQALARRGRRVRQYIEDIDVAFTAVAASPGDPLQLAMERFHASGGQDWGAALFYNAFLGRLPVDVRQFDDFLGRKIKVVARDLHRELTDLYDEFSPGDNYQLIGPSYVGDQHHHRVIGDLTTAETAEFLRQLFDIAERDMLDRFPAADCRKRVGEWFAAQRAIVDRAIAAHAGGRLVDVYRDWSSEAAGDGVEWDVASRLFATGANSDQREILDIFVKHYDEAAAMYNEAVAESGVHVHPLRISQGELPMFATMRRDSHVVRAEARLVDGELVINDRAFALGEGGGLPVDELRRAGVQCLVGKAVLLVIQVRAGANGSPLALPYHGSRYMPAAHALSRKLAAAGLLKLRLAPVVRVRLRLLDRLSAVDAPISLPPHLAAATGRDEMPASELASCWRQLADEASTRLEQLRSDAGRARWQREAHSETIAAADALERRRRELAAENPKDPRVRQVYFEFKRKQAELLDATLRQVDRDVQVSQLDYYDSRGAIMPWCIALGGEQFYESVLAQAEVYEEAP